MRRLCLFHKICNLKSPKYLYNLIPSVNRFYDTRNNTNVPSFNCRTEYFKNSFFPIVITEWNRLDINIKSMTSYNTFKNALLSFIRPKHVDTFGIHNPIGRGGSRTAATFKIELFVIIVNGFQPLLIESSGLQLN